MASETIAKSFTVVAILADEKGKQGNAARQELLHLLIWHCPRIDEDGWRYVPHGVRLQKRPLSTNRDQIEAIGVSGMAGYYEFKPYSAIS